MSLAETMAYEAIAEEYSAPVQLAGLRVEIIDACMTNAATPDEFRRAMVRQLQRTLPAFASKAVRADCTRAPADVFAKTEKLVQAAVIEAAHQSPELRAVVTKDRVGREETTFYGQKRGPGGWMEQYADKPRLMKSINGAPVKLPVVL